MPTLTQECFEAINSGLFRTDFEHLGNTDAGACEWWFRGFRGTPKSLRVAVRQSVMQFVTVSCEWPVFRSDVQYRGTTSFTIPCNGSIAHDQVIDGASEVVEKVLLLFRDVLEGTGQAGPEAIPVETSDE